MRVLASITLFIDLGFTAVAQLKPTYMVEYVSEFNKIRIPDSILDKQHSSRIEFKDFSKNQTCEFKLSDIYPPLSGSRQCSPSLREERESERMRVRSQTTDTRGPTSNLELPTSNS